MATDVAIAALIIGVLALIVGVGVGVLTGESGTRRFAAWVTVIGVGFTVAGLVLLWIAR